MTTPTFTEYYDDAAEDFENSNDVEYHLCHDNSYRLFLIKEHAYWLFYMNEYLRIWE